jgi:RimJ/RimL family protein N-acetyltransferase
MIRLDPIGRQDLIKILEWNSNKTSDDLLQWAGPKYSYPLTLEQLENYFDNEVDKYDSNVFIYKITLSDTNEVIGTVELRKMDGDNGTGRVGRFLIGEEKYRGKGIGTEVLRELRKIGFDDKGFQKITLAVFDFNQGAIKCYENAGFVKEKFLENARKSSSGYWNLYEMGITKDKWQGFKSEDENNIKLGS